MIRTSSPLSWSRMLSALLMAALITSSTPLYGFAQELPECGEGEVFSEQAEGCVPYDSGEGQDDEGDGAYCAIVSDPMTTEGGDASVVLSEVSSFWTAAISGAFWIWGEDPAANQDETTYETFTRTFTLSDIPEGAELEIAADDGYYVSLNDNYIGGANGVEAVNFTSEGQDTYTVPSDYFVEGENTLIIEATNIAWGKGQENPAGILFRLSIEGASCDGGDDDGEDEDTGTLVIEKELEGTDESGIFTFSVEPEEGSSVAMIVETDGRFGREEKDLPEGWYRVSEIVPEGWTLTSATCADEDSFESFKSEETEGEMIYLDEGETLTCTFVNTKEDVQTPEKEKKNGHTSGRVRSSGGQVLGASTECSPLLTSYLGKGYQNSADEVTKLQNFLNDNQGAAVPVTGQFDAATEHAVRVFQVKYWEDVLKPWFVYPEYGVLDSDDSTGIVYKTTQWKINDLFCPGSQAVPMLP